MQAHSYYQNVSICENATALDRMGRVFARPGSECSVSANVSLGLNRFYHECNDQETRADIALKKMDILDKKMIFQCGAQPLLS